MVVRARAAIVCQLEADAPSRYAACLGDQREKVERVLWQVFQHQFLPLLPPLALLGGGLALACRLEADAPSRREKMARTPIHMGTCPYGYLPTV